MLDFLKSLAFEIKPVETDCTKRCACEVENIFLCKKLSVFDTHILHQRRRMSETPRENWLKTCHRFEYLVIEYLFFVNWLFGYLRSAWDFRRTLIISSDLHILHIIGTYFGNFGLSYPSFVIWTFFGRVWRFSSYSRNRRQFWLILTILPSLKPFLNLDLVSNFSYNSGF